MDKSNPLANEWNSGGFGGTLASKEDFTKDEDLVSPKPCLSPWKRFSEEENLAWNG